MKTILIAIFFCLAVTTPAFSQDEEGGDDDDNTSTQQISRPEETSYLFDQYNPNDVASEDERQKIELFVTQIKNTSEFAEGRIYVYRGKRDYKFDASKRSDFIDKILKPLLEKNSMLPYKVFTRFGGFREESAVEMVFGSPSTSAQLAATPTVSLLDLKFYDDASLPKGTIQRTGEELLNDLTKKADPVYPAAAKAVRASGEVGILVKIDEKGGVTETKVLIGHPLLQSACVAAVRQWQFKPQKFNKAPVTVVGIVRCEFIL